MDEQELYEKLSKICDDARITFTRIIESAERPWVITFHGANGKRIKKNTLSTAIAFAQGVAMQHGFRNSEKQWRERCRIIKSERESGILNLE